MHTESTLQTFIASDGCAIAFRVRPARNAGAPRIVMRLLFIIYEFNFPALMVLVIGAQNGPTAASEIGE